MRRITVADTAQDMFGPRAHRMAQAMATTPGQLRIAIGGLWVLAIIFAWMVSIGLERHRHEMQTIGKDTAPSIIAAQSIKANIASLHGDAIRHFLGTPEQERDARPMYAEHRRQITDGILRAAQNIAFAEAERVPIRDLLNGLASYDDAIGRANALEQHGDSGYLPALRDATNILENMLYPNIDLLNNANQDAMDTGYTTEQEQAGWSTMMTIFAALLLLAGMVGVQILIQRRMHRRFSLPLLGAALFTVGWTFCVVNAMTSVTHDLKVADKDAFDSIGAMWRARADAFDAQTHLAWSLLDPGSASKARQMFDRDASTLVQLPAGMSFSELQNQVAAGGLPQGFAGEIAAELGNITFDGEKDAADDMLKQYAGYFAIAHQVIDTDQSGQHAAAVKLCLGDAGDHASGAMNEFDSALGRVLDINQTEFDRAVKHGFADVEGLWAWNYGVMLLVMILSYNAVAARLREYNQ